MFRPSVRLSLTLHGLFLAGLFLLSWMHGLPFLMHQKYIADLQYEYTWVSALGFGLLAALCVNYFFFLRMDVDVLSDRALSKIVTGFTLLGICALPMNTGDFFSYIEFGRLVVLHHLSPYVHGYGAIQDAYSSYSWFGQTTNYGPLTLLSFFPAALASELSPYAGFFVMKLTWLAVAGACLWIVRQNFGWSRNLLWFALNPLWLVEVLINGHNDVIGVLLILLAIDFWRESDQSRASSTAVLLPSFKFPLGVLPAFLATDFLRQKRWKDLGAIVFGQILVLIVIGAILGDSENIANFLSGSAPVTVHSFWGRIAWIIQTFAPMDPATWGAVTSRLPLFGLVGTLLTLCVLVFVRRRKQDEFRRWGLFIAWLVFFWGMQYWAWYGLWILPLAIFWQNRRSLEIFSIAAFAGFVQYAPWYWDVILRSLKQQAEPWESIWIVFPSLAFVVAVALWIGSPRDQGLQ